jgi:DNA gyrase/topoisomerase IV subunit A
LISQVKIDEWIREIEERPASAELIIRYIARRLSELAARDEELASQNIELLSGRKVEEYESRIASLEYQLELLKRQLGGEVILPTERPSQVAISEKINLVLYNPLGQVLRVEMDPTRMTHGQVTGRISAGANQSGMPLELLVASSQDELLFIFDMGRTVRKPVNELPLVQGGELDWQKAFIEDPRGKEELAAIEVIGKMPLYELCIQASRRGYVKKMKTSFFTAHLEEDYIGSGVKVRADKTCGITFTNPGDLFVMVSQLGYIFSMQAERLPIAIEEVLQLGNTDHIVSKFNQGKKPSLVFVTENGKAVHRDTTWLEPANTFKSRGQSILSKERRTAGMRIVAAAAVDETDWGAILQGDGNLTIQQVRQMIAAGSVMPGQAVSSVAGFSVFQLPEING